MATHHGRTMLIWKFTGGPPAGLCRVTATVMRRTPVTGVSFSTAHRRLNCNRSGAVTGAVVDVTGVTVPSGECVMVLYVTVPPGFLPTIVSAIDPFPDEIMTES